MVFGGLVRKGGDERVDHPSFGIDRRPRSHCWFAVFPSPVSVAWLAVPCRGLLRCFSGCGADWPIPSAGRHRQAEDRGHLPEAGEVLLSAGGPAAARGGPAAARAGAGARRLSFAAHGGCPRGGSGIDIQTTQSTTQTNLCQIFGPAV